MNFQDWWDAQDFDPDTEPGEIARAAWAEAFKQATEQAAVVAENCSAHNVWMVANLIRQQGEDV